MHPDYALTSTSPRTPSCRPPHWPVLPHAFPIRNKRPFFTRNECDAQTVVHERTLEETQAPRKYGVGISIRQILGSVVWLSLTDDESLHCCVDAPSVSFWFSEGREPVFSASAVVPLSLLLAFSELVDGHLRPLPVNYECLLLALRCKSSYVRVATLESALWRICDM